MTAVTVIIPTHDHGSMVGLAARTALRQTIADIEVVIIGDGATDDTRAACAAVVAEDRRVRFLDLPKGPRLGEVHRRQAIAETDGEVILYLSDDDLWFPDHAARMVELLDGADVANALSCWIRSEGVVQHTTLDLSIPQERRAVLEGRKNPGLTPMGHTRAWYEQLPFGWRTTPEDTPTDLHMWRQLLDDDAVVARSGMVPTLVQLPSPPRRHLTLEARVEEMAAYERLASDPEWRRWYVERVLDGALRECAFFWTQSHELKAWADAKEEELKETWQSRGEARHRVAQLEAELLAARGGEAAVSAPRRRWRRRP